jgi:glycosyltransferase involved in cell wall biosynthesis
MEFATIVIPVYNGEKTLREAIDSALSQTYGAFEVLVVDDGSTDGSADIVRSYDDPRLRMVQQENGGLNSARNTGIRMAKSDLIGLLDADDLWAPTKLAKQIEHLESDPTIGLSFAGSWMIDLDSKPTGLHQTPQTKDISTADLLYRNPVGNGSTPVMRRAMLDEIAHPHPTKGHTCWFDEELRQSTDIECWIRLSLQTEWKVEGIDEPLTGYRVNPAGLSANVLRQYETWLQMVQKTAAYAPEFIAEHGALAKACQLRYLTRRAVSLRQPGLAWAFAKASLSSSPRILFDQPIKTITTVGAATVLRVTGVRFYAAIEGMLLSMLRAMPVKA